MWEARNRASKQDKFFLDACFKLFAQQTHDTTIPASLAATIVHFMLEVQGEIDNDRRDKLLSEIAQDPIVLRDVLKRHASHHEILLRGYVTRAAC
jgi:hypothetical protein